MKPLDYVLWIIGAALVLLKLWAIYHLGGVWCPFCLGQYQ